jgi:hypothetical protein
VHDKLPPRAAPTAPPGPPLPPLTPVPNTEPTIEFEEALILVLFLNSIGNAKLGGNPTENSLTVLYAFL